MGTFRQRNASTEPTIVVGWAAGLVNAWPEESSEPIVVAGATASGTPEAVLETLAAADGEDPHTYRRTHGHDGAVLALTHHSVEAILAAALQVRDELTPSAVLDALHGRAPRAARVAVAPRRQLVDLIAS